MKNRKQTALFVAVIMILSLCACGGRQTQNHQEDSSTSGQPTITEVPSQEPAQNPSQPGSTAETVITDMIGREVTVIPGSYKRVVCVGAGALRMYSYVGDISLLCGVEDIDNTSLSDRPKMFDGVARPYLIAYEDVFAALDSCGVGGPNAQTAEAEKILACSPDIVISEFEDVEREDALQEQLGVPVITLRAGPDGVFDDAFAQSMTLLGTIFNREEGAAALVSFVEAEREEISNRTSGIAEEDKPGVYICGLGNWGTTNHLMTSETYSSFTVANVANVVTDLGTSGVQPIEEEKFVSLGDDMDIIIMDSAAVKNIKPLYQEDSTMFDSCKAWRSGEVYLQMAYNAYYTNFETALINTWFIAKTVYPDAFEDIDIIEKTNEITKVFLGRELAEQIFAYPNNFGGYQRIDVETFFN